MILPYNANVDFVNWLEKELEKREWSRSDLARKGGISQPQVTRVLNRQQNPGLQFCNGVARAFDVTPDEVLRHANILPKETVKDEWVRRVEHQLERITDEEDRRLITGLIDLLSPDKRARARRENKHAES